MKQQVERQRVEQAAQAGRVTTMYADAEQQIFALEGMAQDAKAKRRLHPAIIIWIGA